MRVEKETLREREAKVHAARGEQLNNPIFLSRLRMLYLSAVANAQAPTERAPYHGVS